MQRVQDIAVGRFAIEGIMFGYAEAIDYGDMETVGMLFAKGSILMPDGGSLEGTEAVCGHYSDIIRFYDADENEVPYVRGEPTPRTKHVITNIACSFNNAVDQADVRSYFTVYQNLDGQNTLIAGGRYVDVFKLDLQGWFIRTREIYLDNPGDISRHLKTDFQS